VGFQKSAWACELRQSVFHASGMITDVSLRLLYLILIGLLSWLALLGRASSSDTLSCSSCATKGRDTPQNQPQAPPRLVRPSRARRADPTPARGAARSPPGHPGHRPAVAPPPGHQEMDLPEPRRSPTHRRHDRRPDRTVPARTRPGATSASKANCSSSAIASAHRRSAGSSRSGGYRRHHCERPIRPGDGSCARRPRPCSPWTSSTSTVRSP
jgi:hypothetical protein